MARKNVHTIRGTGYWMKVLGNPVPNYNEDGYEWTFDLTPDEEGRGTLEDLGLGNKIRDEKWRKEREAKTGKPCPVDERGDYIPFRQREKRLDGSLNRRISVTDARGAPWPDDVLIGNGSIVDVKFEFKDYGPGKHPGVYPQAIRVLKHQPYERVEFAPLPEDDPYAQPAEGKLPEGMEPEPKQPVPDDFPE